MRTTSIFSSSKQLLKSNWISFIAKGLILWIALMLFGLFAFLQYYFSEIREMIEGEWRIYTILSQPFYEGGMILAAGLFLMLMFKFSNKNITVIALGLITVIGYFYMVKFKGIL